MKQKLQNSVERIHTSIYMLIALGLLLLGISDWANADWDILDTPELNEDMGIELMFGRTRVDKLKDGTWVQRATGDTSESRESNSAGIGAVYSTQVENLSVIWGFKRLIDDYRTSCPNCISNDQAYLDFRDAGAKRWPAADFQTRGKLTVAYFGGEYDLYNLVDLRGGVYLGKNQMDVRVTDFRAAPCSQPFDIRESTNEKAYLSWFVGVGKVFEIDDRHSVALFAQWWKADSPDNQRFPTPWSEGDFVEEAQISYRYNF